MAKRDDITASYVRERLDYNPKTGEFRWRPRLWNSRCCEAWNKKNLGKPAGTLEHGYIRINIGGIQCYAHRLAWLYIYGQWPKIEIDHINGDPSDNRLKNLRLSTSLQNKRNSKKPIHNTSGYKGVSRAYRSKTWRSSINLNNKTIHLGCFDTREEAHSAYCYASKTLFGAFVRTK